LPANKAPETTADWKAAGYDYLEQRVCRGKDCRATIEWWMTPNGKKMPLSTTILGTIKDNNRREALVPHHAVCPNVGDFRR
jgi:hypothetical protein